MTDQVPTPEPVPTTPVTPAAPAPAAPAYAAPAATAPWNVLAIISLIVSIVGFGTLSLVAVILGHLGLSQIKRTPQQGRPLALAGTIIGYVGILATIVFVIFWVLLFAAAAASGTYNY